MANQAGIGGGLLGLFGFGSWDGGATLGTGRLGWHGNPDGKPSASKMNLLINATDNRQINTAGDVLLINDA